MMRTVATEYAGPVATEYAGPVADVDAVHCQKRKIRHHYSKT